MISAKEKSEVGKTIFILTLSSQDFSTHAYTDQKVLSEICPDIAYFSVQQPGNIWISPCSLDC
jgi:hypothetical protein